MTFCSSASCWEHQLRKITLGSEQNCNPLRREGTVLPLWVVNALLGAVLSGAGAVLPTALCCWPTSRVFQGKACLFQPSRGCASASSELAPGVCVCLQKPAPAVSLGTSGQPGTHCPASSDSQSTRVRWQLGKKQQSTGTSSPLAVPAYMSMGGAGGTA